jgi:hypothetical protein
MRLRVAILQYKALIKKNLLLQLRDWKISLIQLGAPIVFVLVMILFQSLPSGYPVGDNPILPIPRIPKCVSYTRPVCISLLYSPPGTETDAIMSIVARRNHFKVGQIENYNFNVPLTESIPALPDILSVRDTSTGNTFILQHPNVTQIGKMFT